MMVWHIYLHKGTVFVPTVAKTEAGYFLDVDPVAVIGGCDRDGIVGAVKAAITKGNPIVPIPTRAAFPKPVVLSHANVKSWAAFGKSALCWTILQTETAFQLCPQRKHLQGGWEDDQEGIETFTGTAAIDLTANSVAEKVAGKRDGGPTDL